MCSVSGGKGGFEESADGSCWINPGHARRAGAGQRLFGAKARESGDFPGGQHSGVLVPDYSSRRAARAGRAGRRERSAAHPAAGTAASAR